MLKTVLMCCPVTVALLLAGSLGMSGEYSDVEITVGGMSSPMCSMAVRLVVGGMDGVHSVQVDRESSRLAARYDPAVTTPARIASAVRSLGFTTLLPGDTGGETLNCESGSCFRGTVSQKAAELSGLSEDQVEAVVDYVTSYIVDNETIPTGNEIREATDVTVTRASIPFLQQAVMERLLTDPVGHRLMSGSRCNDYGACSVHRNLLTASGEELDMYFREKKEDGRSYTDRLVPAFAALDLDGRPVSTDSLTGARTVLAFLSFHCVHSTQSLGLLGQLQKDHPGVRVVAVLVNSTKADEAEKLLRYHWPDFDRQFETWVYDDPALGDVIESHLVPTYMLVDEEGQVIQKLVGFKTGEELAAAVGRELTGLSTAKGGM